MPSREQILAASAGWVAVLLNVVPGLGAGYLYQRRWKAYWITSALATAWFVAGAVLGQDAEPAAEAQNQLVGLIGLLLLAGGTATEAGLAVNEGAGGVGLIRARKHQNNKCLELIRPRNDIGIRQTINNGFNLFQAL